MKNYEKIKNMSVKEMSRFIYDIATFCNRNGCYKTQDFVNIVQSVATMDHFLILLFGLKAR